MSSTDQLLVEAFRQNRVGKFTATPVGNTATLERAEAVETIATMPVDDVVTDNTLDASPDDTRSLIGLLNRQAAGIEAESSSEVDGTSSGPSGSGVEKWQPALEVDRFAWPPVVETVLSTAGAALGQFADRRIENARNQTQLIAVIGDRAESGATTMTLSLARLFAAQQLSVVLVDLDESNPELAQALGVRPMISWLATLDEGVAIEEVLIESVNDRITLSPLCRATGDPARIEAIPVAERFWNPLASHFNVILADCGTGANCDQLATVLSAAGVSELVVVADNRCDEGQVAELVRPLLDQIRPLHWSVIRNFTDA